MQYLKRITLCAILAFSLDMSPVRAAELHCAMNATSPEGAFDGPVVLFFEKLGEGPAEVVDKFIVAYHGPSVSARIFDRGKQWLVTWSEPVGLGEDLDVTLRINKSDLTAKIRGKFMSYLDRVGSAPWGGVRGRARSPWRSAARGRAGGHRASS